MPGKKRKAEKAAEKAPEKTEAAPAAVAAAEKQVEASKPDPLRFNTVRAGAASLLRLRLCAYCLLVCSSARRVT